MSAASSPDLAGLSPIALLRIHSDAAEELRRRGYTRSANSPLGDLAEKLFCDTFGWRIAPASMAAADAVCSGGKQYQIKSRRLTGGAGDRQLSAIRNLGEKGFDYLAGVLFGKRYDIQRAALIPHAVVVEKARFQKHTNAHIFFLTDDVWLSPQVSDVTAQVRATADLWSDPSQ